MKDFFGTELKVGDVAMVINESVVISIFQLVEILQDDKDAAPLVMCRDRYGDIAQWYCNTHRLVRIGEV
jgi:hypothetical protein